MCSFHFMDEDTEAHAKQLVEVTQLLDSRAHALACTQYHLLASEMASLLCRVEDYASSFEDHLEVDLVMHMTCLAGDWHMAGPQ